MNELLDPESTEPSSAEDSTLNSLLLRLRAAADNMHTTLVAWETHIDHPGARTAIHSAARGLLDAASAMPTHYDDGSERIKQLERHVRVLEIRSNFLTMELKHPELFKEQTKEDR